jgi:hypothetical protein
LHSNYFLTSRTKNLSQAQIDCSRKSVEGDEEVREAKRKRNTKRKKYEKKDDDRLLFALTGGKNTLITRLHCFQRLIRYNGLIFFTPRLLPQNANIDIYEIICSLLFRMGAELGVSD